jgi:hypothetical protein
MPDAPLCSAVYARMQGRSRERGESRRVYRVERGEPVCEGGECAAKRGRRTCWYIREGFLSWRDVGVYVWGKREREARWLVRGTRSGRKTRVNIRLVGFVRMRERRRVGPSRVELSRTMYGMARWKIYVRSWQEEEAVKGVE